MSGDIQENCSIDGKRTSEDSSVNDTSQMSARDNSVYKSIDCDDLILENINLPGTQFASLSFECVPKVSGKIFDSHLLRQPMHWMT